jgi:single-stranded-DNA-specific exonuclease
MDPATPPFLGVGCSVTGRQWRARAGDDRMAQALSQQLGLAEVVGRVLAGRGLDLDQAERFLQPTLRDWLPDPSSLPDMDVAAARLAAAVMAGERIAIFGDYDVDGATSAALLKLYLGAVGSAADTYIPDRQREGYGPNPAAMRLLAERGARVVITVDCGTTAHAALAVAQAAGLEVIVVDHHLAEPELPAAVAVVNANRVDVSADPDLRGLAAVGVSFLLAVATNRTLRAAGWFAARPEPDLLQWLDLVALGTVCDVAPLTGINRALVSQGLKVMARRGNAGLAALADVAGLSQPPNAYNAGFQLGPRVNAGGRIGQADLGVRLLTSNDRAAADALAGELNRLNRERQDIEAAVQDAAMMQARQTGDLGPLVVVAGEGWHAGVIGIVASRIKEAMNRVSIVIAIENGVGKGSGRSVAGVDLGAAITAARQSGLLLNGGGHAMAAGFTVAAERMGELKAFLVQRLAPAVARLPASASLGLDGALAPAGATGELFDQIEQVGPFGAGNPEPRFAMAAVRIVVADVVGERHVRCVLAGGDGSRLKAIAFNGMGNSLGPALLAARADGRPCHVAGRLRADYWRGERRVELVVDDAASIAAVAANAA